VKAEDLDYYTSQSPVTDPGEMRLLLTGLPADLAVLQRVARGLVIHYRAENLTNHGIGEERLAEIDSRYVEPMLARLAELATGPLTESRSPNERLVGCCRDFTVLFVSMARSLGIPARARVGFASYFLEGFNVDHEVAEAWDANDRRWRLVDAELEDEHADPADGARIDPLDVPRDRFLVGGTAWQRCRAGNANPESFVVAPDLDVEMTRSWPYLRHNLVHDLAALNKIEMILWDTWGLMEQERLSDDDFALLDRVAEATTAADVGPSEVRRLYESDPRLQVPQMVTSYSPLTGARRKIALQ
jgi:hypothetical protein